MPEENVQIRVYAADALDEKSIRRLVSLVNGAYSRHRWLFPEDRTSYREFCEEIAGKELVLLLTEPAMEIVGTALIPTDEHSLYLGMAAIDLTRQGQGLGARLMKAVEEIARQRNLAKIKLITVRELGNVEYYRQKGFQVVSEQRQPAGTWGAVGPYWLATMEKKI